MASAALGLALLSHPIESASGQGGGPGGAAEARAPAHLPADSAAFLDRCRRPDSRAWAVMRGQASHRRRTAGGAETRSAPIRLGIRFLPDRILARMRIGDSEEYSLMQPFGGAEATVVRLDAGGAGVLADFGLRPEDLAMAFLHWTPVRECPPETVKLGPCRVFDLRDASRGETVRVYINRDFFAPVKAEWTKDGCHDPYRSMEVSAMSEAGKDIYVPSTIKLHGPGWRTIVEFDDAKAGDDGAPPPDIFIPAPSP